MRARRVLLAALAALAITLPLFPAGAPQQTGVPFELDLDRATFFGLSGRSLSLGFVAFNFRPNTVNFRLECSGEGVTASPPQSLNITGGGSYIGNFSVAAASPGEYDLTVTMSDGNETARGLATATFLPPLSCRFVSPAANDRIGVVGVGQSYTGRVNFTNFGGAPLSPTFALPERDLLGRGEGTSAVTLRVGEVPAGGSALFSYEGSSLASTGTRDISPVVMAGGLPALYGFEVFPDGVTNVTRFGFTLAARELLGVGLSEDRFPLGGTSTVTLYVESRLSKGVASGTLEVGLRSDIAARRELADYAAEERFEEFTGLVESRVSFTRRYDLGPMAPGVQKELGFEFAPRMCRASDAGGSYFLDFWADLGGTAASATLPVSVVSPLELAFVTHEKVSYLELGQPLGRVVAVRNLSNSTISGATASFFLDYRGKGFVTKADIASTPKANLPSLGPGEAAAVTLELTPFSPGTYTFFPVMEWGGLSVYGSHIVVVASSPGGAPIGAYVTAALVILVPVALTRRLTPG
ncbi:MAG: hypothetical protein FJ149_10305 [Euryarchaeota archaeon]|nr:hypothetical protein [Euryarchaeota archaeon]